MIKPQSILWLFLLFGSIWIGAYEGDSDRTDGITEPQATSCTNPVIPVDSLTFTVDLEDEDGIYRSPQPIAFCILQIRKSAKAVST